MNEGGKRRKTEGGKDHAGRLKAHMKESLLAAVLTSPGWLCLGRVSVPVCVRVCMFACMHRSAAAKQRLLYKAGPRLCPEVPVISLSVTHTCAQVRWSANTHTGTKVHKHGQTGSSEVSVITPSQSKERLSSTSRHTATLHLSLNSLTSSEGDRERKSRNLSVCVALHINNICIQTWPQVLNLPSN